MAKEIFDTYHSFVLYAMKQKQLSKEETLVLLKEYRDQASDEIMEELMNGHLPLVLSLVKKYNNQGNVDPMDLVQSGLNGLFHAIVNYDFSRNVLFSTYAYTEIEFSIREFLQHLSHTVKIPERVIRKYIEITKTKRELAEKMQRQPTEKEIVEALDFQISEADMRSMLAACQAPLSLDCLIDDDNDDKLTFKDMLISEDDPAQKVEADIEEQVIREAIDSLPSKYRELILERYQPTENGKPVPFDKLSHKYTESINQLRYMEDWALERISKYYERKLNRKL